MRRWGQSAKHPSPRPAAPPRQRQRRSTAQSFGLGPRCLHDAGRQTVRPPAPVSRPRRGSAAGPQPHARQAASCPNEWARAARANACAAHTRAEDVSGPSIWRRKSWQKRSRACAARAGPPSTEHRPARRLRCGVRHGGGRSTCAHVPRRGDASVLRNGPVWPAHVRSPASSRRGGRKGAHGAQRTRLCSLAWTFRSAARAGRRGGRHCPAVHRSVPCGQSSQCLAQPEPARNGDASERWQRARQQRGRPPGAHVALP